MGFINKITKAVKSKYPSVTVKEEKGCTVLEGELSDWNNIVSAGKLAVNKKSLGVINNIKLTGFTPSVKLPVFSDKAYDGAAPDVLIIGGGITGAAIARELSKWKLDIMLAEKSYDVAVGASSRNDGCVHVGIDLKPNQQKLKYNSAGNKIYAELCEELNVPFERKGHILLFYKKWERSLVPIFKFQAKRLGIKGIRYISIDELKERQPSIASWCKGGILMPSGGIVSPYKLTVALAENAAVNGAKICLNTAVLSMEVENGVIKSVTTNRGVIYPKMVVNAAGVFADSIADMAGDRTFTIHPRKGINLILDKKVGYYAHTSIAKSPFAIIPEDGKQPPKGLLNNIRAFAGTVNSTSHTKGGGVVRTADGNILVGPNAIETPNREDYSTDIESVNSIFRKQKTTAEAMEKKDIITYFAGVRAPTYEEDFVVRKGIFTENIIEAAGIQSPGLTAAPGIAIEVADWAVEMLSKDKEVIKNEEFNPIRKGIPHLAAMGDGERNELIKQNPDYGIIVCRCEEVSKGEIIDALNSPVPVYTVDGIKRRVRPGMGRCQGGFCGPLVMKIISEHTGKPLDEICKADTGSNILFGETKGGAK